MATSPGSYKGVEIKGGSDAEIAAQMADIDAKGTPSKGSGGSVDAPAETPSSSGGGSSDPFIKELQKSLLAQSGMVSSASSNIEKSIDEAISGVRRSNEASTARIESEYSRERSFQLGKNATSEEAFFENRTGYATSVTAFTNLREYNAKSIKDLDQRKNELILAGDAAAAGKIAELQLQKLSFEQQAAQQTFQNLLGIGNFSLNVQAGERADRAQNFQERSAMGAIALQYGISLQDGDTIDDVVTRAMPMASEEQKLKLEQIRTSIAENKAQTAAALASAERARRESQPLDAATVAALASAYRNGGGAIVAGAVKDPSQLGAIFAAAGQMEAGDVDAFIKKNISEGKSLQATLEELKTSEAIAITDYNAAATAAANAYVDVPARSTAFPSAPALVGAGAKGYSMGVNSFLEWMTGIDSPSGFGE